MAKVGMEYVVSGLLKEAEDGTPSYTGGKYWGPASTFNGSPTANDAKDYGDDRAVETDTSVTGGTLSVELNENTLELESFLLGHTYDKEKKQMICNQTDVAPFVGTGAIGKSKRNNKIVYKGKFYHKTQFKNPNDENSTKQESTTFNHTTLEGNIFTLPNGQWKEEQEFESLEEAKTWLDNKVGITAAGA